VDEATRPILWNISHGWLMYVLFAVSLAIAAWGARARVLRWRIGQPEPCFDRPWERTRRFVRHAVVQVRTWRVFDAGLMHASIYVGFVVLTIATVVVLVEHDLGVRVMHGAFYLYFQSLLVDLFGLAVLGGVVWAAWRRRPGGPAHLVRSGESWGLLALVFAIVASGFLVEGWRIAATSDPWAAWSPVGGIAGSFSARVLSPDALLTWHRVAWWSHLAAAFALIAWAPYTKLVHVFFAPLNIYAGPLAPAGASLKPIDFDRSERLGVNSLSGFTWKDLLDLDACTECGRCTAACPAHRVGKSLSPRDIILGLRGLLHAQAPAARPGVEVPTGVGAPADHGMSAGSDAAGGSAIIGAVPATSPEALWACTTCAACMEACPVLIAQMPKIVDMRRHLTMEEADLPESLQAVVRSLESRGHPFPGTQASRIDWAAGLDIPEASSGANAETILWVGCAGALVDRGQKATRALASLLKRAGVPFAILGREEKCTGDVARRLGHEFLFEQLARDNVATLTRYGVKRIITACPHCLNTLRHEYPRLGGTYEVVHHSELLAQLVADGRLDPAPAAPGVAVTYHDPCYLGRQNGILDPPRAVLRHATGTAPVEMAEHGTSSFCCGGGGGLLTDELMDIRVKGALPRMEALKRVVDDHGVNFMATICAICKAQFTKVLPYYGFNMRLVGGVHQLVSSAIKLGNEQ
jgi:Fe-S oxidoreductase